MSKKTIFRGVCTALITPFRADGGIDAEAFAALVTRQREAGVAALLTGGTTGEAPTLSDDERITLIRIAKENCGGLPVIAGAGSNDTRHAVRMAEDAERAGADALLTVTPYYNRTTPAGLVGYYRAVCLSTSLPVIAYSVPARTGMRIPPSIHGELFALPNLVGFKDAEGDPEAAGRLIARFGREISVWSGNDALALPYLSLGADGVISVLSNVLPAETAELCRLFFAGDTAGAARLAARLFPLNDALFAEVSPIPVKAALALLGLCREDCRPPLCPPSDATRQRLTDLLAAF